MSNITVYGTDWCSDCIRAKRFFTSHGIAFQSIDVEGDAEADKLVRDLQGGDRRVPTVVFEDNTHLVEPTHQELAEKLGIVPVARTEKCDIAIIGGGPAGLTAAIYAGRQGYTTLVIDSSSFGGQAATTKQIDNYPGFPEGVGGGSLSELFLAQATGPTTELLSATSVTDVGAHASGDAELALSNGQRIRAKTVMIATGTTYRTLGVPGEKALVGKRIHFCSTCDGPAYRGRRQLVVVGGGNSACEEALYLATLVEEVVLLQNLPELTADPVLRQRVLADPKIKVFTDTAITGFAGNADSFSVSFVAGGDATATELHPDAVFEFIGLTANSGVFAGHLERDGQGYICVDQDYRTTLARVYAAGDVRSGSTKQLVSAAGDAVSCLLKMRDAITAERERELESANA